MNKTLWYRLKRPIGIKEVAPLCQLDARTLCQLDAKREHECGSLLKLDAVLLGYREAVLHGYDFSE